MAQKQAMLIFTDAKENNNKFYEIILQDNGTVDVRWGRVGADGQKKSYSGGEYEYNRIINSKIAKGYVQSKTVQVATQSQGTTSKAALEAIAQRDLISENSKGDKTLSQLIQRLTDINRHQISAVSNGNIQIDDSGLIKTPLGLVTVSTIDEAREILDKIENYVSKSNYKSAKYIELLEDYLKLIPQRVPARRGWYETFFTEHTSLTNQSSFLDQLESSIDLYKSKEQDALKAANKKADATPVFETKLELVSDDAVIKRIIKFFNESRNTKHVSSHLKLKNVFTLNNKTFEEKFNKKSSKIGNVKTLWHGTRAFNVLSILKGGLIIPKSGGNFVVNGRMFGNGVYFSDQSTKSLNYSYGYWDHGAKDDNCFMFLADVAMGKEYVPSGPSSQLPKPGYHSTFAKAHKSGVINNEMIVYDLDQFYLKYLCEFSSR